MVPFKRSVWVRIVFASVNFLGMLASRHLLSRLANLLWMDVNIKPECMYTRMGWRFPVWYFLTVALCESWCIFTSRPSSCLCNSFFRVINPFSVSVMLFLFPYFSLISLECGCWILHPLVGRIFFSYFGRSCFVCITWFYPNIFWVSLLNLSWEFFIPVLADGFSLGSEWQQTCRGRFYSFLGLLSKERVAPSPTPRFSPIYPTPPLGQDMTRGQFLSRV